MGSLSPLIRVGFILSFFIIFSLLIYIALIDKKASVKDRKLAWLLLLQQFIAGAILTYFATVILPSVAILITNTLFVISYAYAAFSQMISERNLQRGSLQARLTLVILIVAIPVMVASTVFITNQAQTLLQRNANQTLMNASTQLQGTFITWLEANTRALKQLANLPAIRSMDPEEQKLFLNNLISANTGLQFVSTVDRSGQTIARSDDRPLTDFGEAKWLQDIFTGSPLSLATIADEASGEELILVAVPVNSRTGKVVGALVFGSKLSSFREQMKAPPLGTSGFTYMIDAQDQIIAHSRSALIPALEQLSDYPAVQLARGGNLGPFRFADSEKIFWRARAELLPNDWIVIAQSPESEILGSLVTFQRVTWITLLIEGVLLLVLAGLMIRQTVSPIHSLTKVTSAVAAGDFSQVIHLNSNDELGTLARTFNSMTGTLQHLIGDLENRVAERTEELERRAMQLQVAAEVARESAAIRDLDALLEFTVHLISERFGFYHAGIFLIDSPAEYAVLVAASSEGGKKMLSKGHKLKVGAVGIVGHTAQSGEPKIALDVGQEAVFFNNPDLPLTRSEMALPLKSHKKTIGILDVQSTIPSAFNQEDVDTLLILADQIALAIETARLFRSSQEALEQLEGEYRKQVELSWYQRLKHAEIAYVYNGMAVKPFSYTSQTSSEADHSDERILRCPIQVRGVQIGMIELQRDNQAEPWSALDAQVTEAITAQVALALDNARLQEAIRRQVQKEQIASKIAAQTQSSLDIETVMKRAVKEIGKSLNAEIVQIRLDVGGQNKNLPGNGNGRKQA
jgi:GAF domain-containing protein/HAMP domain-containing protein